MKRCKIGLISHHVSEHVNCKEELSQRSSGSVAFQLLVVWNAIHQCLKIIIKLRIVVLLLVSTLPYVVKVWNYS
jgi:hypothetical protein